MYSLKPEPVQGREGSLSASAPMLYRVKVDAVQGKSLGCTGLGISQQLVGEKEQLIYREKQLTRQRQQGFHPETESEGSLWTSGFKKIVMEVKTENHLKNSKSCDRKTQ